MLEDKVLAPEKVNKHSYLPLLNKLDYGVNFFGLLIAIVIGCTALFESSTLLLLAAWNFFFGLYQLISAIIGSTRGNKHKQTYLLIAILYIIMLYIGYLNVDDLLTGSYEEIISIVLLFLLPLIGAAYYTYLCFIAKAKNSHST